MDAGHRLLPHPADVIVEAWAPTPEACLTEAVRALVDSFADVTGGRRQGSHAVHIDDAAWPDLLVAVLDEVIYLLDVSADVPLDARVARVPGAGLSLTFDTAPIADVEVVGSTPKGVSRSGLEFAPDDGLWRCRAIVDV
jgi:SHS2 domain-containing protein